MIEYASCVGCKMLLERRFSGIVGVVFLLQPQLNTVILDLVLYS